MPPSPRHTRISDIIKSESISNQNVLVGVFQKPFCGYRMGTFLFENDDVGGLGTLPSLFRHYRGQASGTAGCLSPRLGFCHLWVLAAASWTACMLGLTMPFSPAFNLSAVYFVNGRMEDWKKF